MQCDNAEKLIGPLVDDELGSQSTKEVETHFGVCDSCERKFELAQSQKDLIKRLFPLLVPSERVESNLMVAFDRIQQERKYVSPNRYKSIFVSKSVFASLIAVVVLVTAITSLGIGYGLGRTSVLPIVVTEPIKGTKIKADVADSTYERVMPTPVTKIVKVPVFREKVITRYVFAKYKDRRSSVVRRTKSTPKPSEPSTSDLDISLAENSYLTQTKLIGYRPVAKIKATLIKGNKINEK